ncbi:hypothetical protein GPECTOR_542g548 [Gonium pectorale]|uniref:Protein kinase domain-containing protein n=1 Tax=Gonium pectorale TaxID=33097 RepID=A0A150FUN3_GONPE|nr:hypothetical protein GPECTOR_542g548 [Gonium pectorale]|eukprot:KXZ41334.1 hypothetical protein GPECTOR_542g548 [Gonium pectorale]
MASASSAMMFRLCITRPSTPQRNATSQWRRCVASELPLLLPSEPLTGLPASNDAPDDLELFELCLRYYTPLPAPLESRRPPSHGSSFDCAPAPAPAPNAPAPAPIAPAPAPAPTTSRLEDIRSLVFGDPSSPPDLTKLSLTYLRRVHFVLRELVCFTFAQPVLRWLPDLVPLGVTPAQLYSTAAAVERLVASLPPAPPTAEALEAATGRVFMARQEVALRAAGCSDAKDAVERLPALTANKFAAAPTKLRHLRRPQLLQARPYGHQEAAVEPINAGGLQDASVALHGGGGPFLAPLYVTVRPLQGPPHVRGYDLEVVFVFEYEPQGDSLQAMRSRAKAIVNAAEAEIDAEKEAAEAAGADPGGSAAQVAAAVTAVSERAARSLVATVEEMVGAMAAALAQLHGLGFVASDNKPANFLPGARGGRGLLTDSEAVEPCGPHQVLMGCGLHTTDYAAPEQIGWNPRRYQASDVWSLGSCAFKLLKEAAMAAWRQDLDEVNALLKAPNGPSARLLDFVAACQRHVIGERPTAAEAAAMLGGAAL